MGINNRTKRDSQVKEKPVNVYIHDIAKTPSNGVENIEVLYHVSVSGKPVPAITAAADMNLVSDEEVVTELGYPFVIKAERGFGTFFLLNFYAFYHKDCTNFSLVAYALSCLYFTHD